MSINNLNTYLNIKDSHLRVVSGNVYAQAMNIGGINVETAHGLQSVSNTGNVTSNTLQFSNAITGFVTTANAQIGRDLIVSGNTTVSTDLTVSANATVADTLTISEHVIASKEATVTGNLHVTTIRSDSNVVAEYTGPHDRPLRKYPEVALTSASQGGYVVTQSNEDTVNSYFAYKAFNEIKGAPAAGTDIWYPGSLSHYNTSDGSAVLSGSDIAPRLDTNTDYGEWIGLELPKPIKLDSFKLWRQFNFQNHHPVSATLYAKKTSSDSWTEIYRYDDIDVRQGDTPGQFNVNSQIFYKFFAFVGRKRSQGVASVDGIGLAELEYYGHEEGSGSLDTTLKSVYNVPATTGTQLEVYYDGQDYTADTDFDQANEVLDKSGNNLHGSQTGGVGFDSTYKAFTFDGTGDYILTSPLSNFTDTGKYSISLWIKIPNYSTRQQVIYQFGHGIAGESFGLDLTNGVLTSFVFLQTNNLSSTGTKHIQNNWFHYTNTFDSDGTRSNMYINGVLDSSTSAMGLATIPSNPYRILGSLFLGDDPTAPTPAGVHPNLHFDGSIANFRLYSKALNADQVKELYDYQKDYFLGSKSQVTLYKGHLGVGVAEPSGQLELAGDERIQAYPPRGMTHPSGSDGAANDTAKNISYIEGHGEFKASASLRSRQDVDYDGHQPYNAFDYDGGNGNLNYTSGAFLIYGPGSGESVGYNKTTGYFEDNNYQLSASSGTPYGHWLQLEMPYKINVKSYFMTPASDDYWPQDWQIWASNDDTNWTHIHTYIGGTYDANPQYYTVAHTGHYKIYTIIVTRIKEGSTLDRLRIKELRYFGTPGPTTLDKGSLTLGRSLDVPSG